MMGPLEEALGKATFFLFLKVWHKGTEILGEDGKNILAAVVITKLQLFDIEWKIDGRDAAQALEPLFGK
jgi:hypothetical protein